jgi:hypothetical protein
MTGRLRVDILPVGGRDDDGDLGGDIVRHIRTENDRVFVAVKFVLVPRSACSSISRRLRSQSEPRCTKAGWGALLGDEESTPCQYTVVRRPHGRTHRREILGRPSRRGQVSVTGKPQERLFKTNFAARVLRKPRGRAWRHRRSAWRVAPQRAR